MARPHNGLVFVAACRTNSAAGAAAFRWQSGGFASVTNAVAGVFVYTLGADYPIDATEFFPILSLDAAQAASQLTSFGVVSTSDTVKTVNCNREAAMGGASTLVDLDHWFACWKRPIR